MNKIIPLLLVLAIFPILITPAFANYSLVIETDKNSYTTGETITIYGEVNSIEPNHMLTINILDSNSNPVMAEQTALVNNDDLTFSLDIIAGAETMNSSGTYEIVGDYDSRPATTSFEYVDVNRLKPYEITATLDHPLYNQGDTITITSQINYPPPVDAHFDIYDPNNTLVYSGIETMFIEEPFYHTLTAGDSLGSLKWETGTYTVNAWHDGGLGGNVSASFEYKSQYNYEVYDDSHTPTILQINNVTPPAIGDTLVITCEASLDEPNFSYVLSYLSVYLVEPDNNRKYTELTDKDYHMATGVDYPIEKAGNYYVSCLFIDGNLNWVQSDYIEFTVYDQGCPEVAYWDEELEQCVYYPDT